MTNPYQPPTTIRQWRATDQYGDEHEFAIRDDRTILMACGQYAQGSGSSSCSWEAFLQGKLQKLAAELFGVAVLREAIKTIEKLQSDE